MTPDAQQRNAASWEAVLADVELYPENDTWTEWKATARRFLAEGTRLGLNRYFRGGQSMHHFVFSTLDHHGLRDEARVTVILQPAGDLRIAYGRGNLHFRVPDVEYVLAFEEGVTTFHRFLCQLWTETMEEPIPADLLS